MKTPLQQLRKKKNLTQAELSSLSNISVRTIQRIESGSPPKGYTLRKLADTLGVDTVELLNESSDDRNIRRIKLINLSALFFLVFPFGNIIATSLLTYRSKDEHARKVGKKIIELQVFWFLITAIVLFGSPLIQKNLHLSSSFLFFILALLTVSNILLVLINGVALSKNGELRIKLKFNLL